MYNRKDAPLEYGLEDLFFRHGVDLQFYGHEHYYIRTFPLYGNVSQEYFKLEHYDDPLAPVHIITGSGGNFEKHPAVNPRAMEQHWVAVQAFDYGFTTVNFDSTSPLQANIQQWSAESNEIVDSFRITKSNPIPAWQR